MSNIYLQHKQLFKKVMMVTMGVEATKAVNTYAVATLGKGIYRIYQIPDNIKFQDFLRWKVLGEVEALTKHIAFDKFFKLDVIKQDIETIRKVI